jgi:hypothetical protein
VHTTKIRQTILHSITGIMVAAADTMDMDKGECSVPHPQCPGSNNCGFE